MDFKYLHTFKTIVDCGSFTKAAQKLNYTQSTITFQIGQLEKELSTCLFQKIGRRMVLTKAGEQLVPYVEDVLASIDKMRYFESDLGEFQGELHIGVAETMLCHKLPAVLKEFHQRAPKARLFLQSMNCYDIRDELVAGNLDLGLFYQEVGGFGNTLSVQELGTYDLALVASPRLASTLPSFTDSDQQIPVSFIINEKECIFRQIFERYLREKNITLDHTIELWSIPTIKELVKSDVGISYLPRYTVEHELAQGDLVELPTTIGTTTITAGCGHHKNQWLSPLMQLMLDLLKPEAGFWK